MVRLHNHIRRHPSVRDGSKKTSSSSSRSRTLVKEIEPQRIAKEEMKALRAKEKMLREKMRRAEANYKRMLAMQFEVESAAATE